MAMRAAKVFPRTACGYRAKDPGPNREMVRAWRRADPERARESQRACRARNPEAARATARRTTARRRARKHAARSIPFTPQQLAQRLSVAGGCCQHCGTSDNLQVDHKVPLARGGPHCLSNLQHLCASCNARKGDRSVG